MKKLILTLSILAVATLSFAQERINARVVNTEEAQLAALAPSDLLRIEAKVSARWSGVRSCCGDGTPDKQIDKAFQKWVKDQLYQHRDKKFVKYGHGGGNARCSSSKSGFPDNKRSCRGSGVVDAYIEFAKN